MRYQNPYRMAMPAFLRELARTPEMQRLRHVGMNCGCEYTSFPRFRGLKPYSRFDHSLGAARIVWDFTEDPAQAAAALFHDIATPTFAHSVDFLRGDHLRQESTEEGTEAMIRGSAEIGRILTLNGIDLDAVVDYHRYPIADNDAPRLSSDRLEYTLGNLLNYGLRTPVTLRLYYKALVVAQNEDGAPELAFQDALAAISFGYDALKCSRIYVSAEDRYAMQMLAELLERAMGRGILREQDLMRTEPEVIQKLLADRETKQEWKCFRTLKEMVTDEAEAPPELRRVIPAKKRYIDPLVDGRGRLSQICPEFEREVQDFLSEDQSGWLYAK